MIGCAVTRRYLTVAWCDLAQPHQSPVVFYSSCTTEIYQQVHLLKHHTKYVYMFIGAFKFVECPYEIS